MKLRKGITTDDILNQYKGVTERRHFYKFSEFGNYVLGFGGSTKRNDMAICYAGGFIIPNWIIAVQNTLIEKMENKDCPNYVAKIVIDKFLNSCDTSIAVSVIFNKELLYFDADEETHINILKKARAALS